MLRNAPKFYEVAKRIVEITEDCIIVAHNSSFDYRILKTEFRRLGFPFKRKTLCTVELSKKLIPNLPSYSLGKLARTLGIPVSDRHRANGDAQATVKLFKLLLHKDLEQCIIKNTVKVEQKSKLTPLLNQIIDGLPSVTGIYYIHDDKGEVIYIGKSRNIKKRITQHFTGKNSKSKKIQALVHAVTYEKTGSELAALLKESEAIKQNKPLLNRALKRSLFSHALYSGIDTNGYITFTLEKVKKDTPVITTFTSRVSGRSFLQKATEDYNLCEKLTGIYDTKTSCFKYEIKDCTGACINKEPSETYNKRASKFIEKYSYDTKNMILIDQGRDVDEKSVYVIENGIFKGMGFFNLNHQINNKDVLLSLITPMSNSRDNQHIIQAYMRKNKRIKVVEFKN